MRRPILNRIVADSDNEISGVQERICRLIGYLPNAATEVWELFSGDGSRSLESSNNRKCRCAKEITNSSAEFCLARHKSEQDHRRFRKIDKTRGVGKRSLASSALRNRRR